MKILKYKIILSFYIFIFCVPLVYSYEICFKQNPNKVYFYPKAYSNLCENIPISKIYVPSRLKRRQIISEMLSNITKDFNSNDIYILEFNFDESELNIEDKFFTNIKFKVEKGRLYKNIVVGEVLVYYAKKFEDFKRHNKIKVYINIFEPIVVSRKKIKKSESLNEKNVYFTYRVSTSSEKEYLSLNDLNNSNYMAQDDIIKNTEIRLNKVQKIN